MTTDQIKVFYDGGCPICQFEVALYECHDKANAIEWVDIEALSDAALPADKSRAELLGRFHVQADDHWHIGVDAFARIWQALPVWRHFAFIFALPGIRQLAEFGYRLFLKWQQRHRAHQREMTKQSPIRDRFWETKSLKDMTQPEWEALCDGCGQCCMAKLIDDDTDELHYTTVACRLFDTSSCRCSDYENRQALVDDCVRLTPDNVGELGWLPQTCAYRLIHERKPLFDWHPLISGTPSSVIEAGISVFGKVTAMEQDMAHEGEYLDHLVEPID